MPIAMECAFGTGCSIAQPTKSCKEISSRSRLSAHASGRKQHARWVHAVPSVGACGAVRVLTPYVLLHQGTVKIRTLGPDVNTLLAVMTCRPP